MENTVELLGHYGGDLTHALSAWTSTSRDLSPEKLGRVDALLEKLAKDGHETPFEKSSLHFLVKTDIASHIHILKHRIGVSVNGESARYKQIKSDDYLIPEDWIGIKAEDESITEMLGYPPTPKEGADWAYVLTVFNENANYLYAKALEELSLTLGRKRAKESARFFKPYSSQISADVMFNFRSFVHFQRLRNHEHAQLEIREIAQKMLDLVKNIEGEPFKGTLKAFGL